MLRGAWADAPWSVSRCNVECETMLLSIGVSGEDQFVEACLKFRKKERAQTGVIAPGNCATIEQEPRGRQRHRQGVINQLIYSIIAVR